MGKLGQVSEIAEFVVFLLSDRSGVVTGSVIDWDQNVLGGHDCRVLGHKSAPECWGRMEAGLPVAYRGARG